MQRALGPAELTVCGTGFLRSVRTPVMLRMVALGGLQLHPAPPIEKGGPAGPPIPSVHLERDHSVTVTLRITSGVPSTAPLPPVPRLIASTTSCPPVTRPTTVY